jgi:hypothetical protein
MRMDSSPNIWALRRINIVTPNFVERAMPILLYCIKLYSFQFYS